MGMGICRASLPEPDVWAIEGQIRTALALGDFDHQGLDLFPTAVLAVMRDLVVAGRERGIEVQCRDWEITDDGRVSASFHVKSDRDAVAFKLLASGI